jgi:CHAD domain-containing protein
MAKVSKDTALSELAQIAITKYLKQGISYEAKVLADTDPEDLHQMRVGLRRLRTALQVFDRAIKLPKPGREPKVAEVARQLGNLRDLDVISEILRQRYGPDLPDPEQRLLVKVLRHLHQQRQKTFKKVKKLLKGKPYRTLVQVLQAWTEEPSYGDLGQLSATMAVPDLIGPLVSQLWLHPGFLVGTKTSRGRLYVETRLSVAATDHLISERGAILHSLRKQVKRVRYQLKLVSDLYDDALDADIERLSDIQETLGNLQDSTVLAEFVTEIIPDARRQMPTLFALLADSRHRAWKQWQTHQAYYLNPTHRQNLRLAVLHPATPQNPSEAASSKKTTAARTGAKAKPTRSSKEIAEKKSTRQRGKASE